MEPTNENALHLHEPCGKSRGAKPPVSPSRTRLHLSKACPSLGWCMTARNGQVLWRQEWVDTLRGENRVRFTKSLF
jgi:hypothetical protein